MKKILGLFIVVLFGNLSVRAQGNLAPSFTPSSAPVISGISPTSGFVGSSVTISGTNFSITVSSNIVYFGAVRATVTAASPTKLTVAVPTGATFEPITVSVNGLVAYSDQQFVPILAGAAELNTNSFAPGFNLSAGDTPGGSAVGDLDGDGKPDLVVINVHGNTVYIYQNISTNGALSSASFAAPVVLPLAGNPIDVKLADLDGDGRLDIVVADAQDSVVSVFQNLCALGTITTNSFSSRVDFPVGQQPRRLAVTDLNGDGRPDIVTANYIDNSISILQNNVSSGVISTNSFATHFDIATGAGPEGVAIGDLDGDGKPDIVTANFDGNSVSIFRNISDSGDLTTNSLAPRVDLTGSGGGEDVVIGDLDGDGKPDLLLSGYMSQAISIFQNFSVPGNVTTNSFGARIDFATGGRAHRVALGCMGGLGGGPLDVVVTTELPNQLLLFKNASYWGKISSNSWASLASLASPVVMAAGWNPNAISITDFDGDGRPDVVICNSYDYNLSVYQNKETLNSWPIITCQPRSQIVDIGQSVSFTVTAIGTQPMTYNWDFNHRGIFSSTNAWLTLTNVQLSDAGNYSVLIANQYTVNAPPGGIMSSDAVLTVSPGCFPSPSGMVGWWKGDGDANDFLGMNPGILEGAVGFTAGEVGQAFNYTNANADVKIPASSILDVGTGAGFTVEAWINPSDVTTYGPVFEWNNGSSWGVHLYTGAVAPNGGPGSLYAALVDDTGGTHIMTSPPGVVTANVFQHVALTYDKNTGVATLYHGGVVAFQQALGNFTPQTSYDLYLGFHPSSQGGPYTFAGMIDEATVYNRALSQNEIQSIYSAGSSGKCFTPTSPIITSQPAGQNVNAGQSATFSVAATGSSPLGYQWYFGGTPIDNATSDTLKLNSVFVSGAGNYYVVITNGYGSVTSSVASLIVNDVITITSQPADQTANEGQSATFSIVATGNPPLSYQWNSVNSLNDGPIANATNATLTLTNLHLNQAGNYYVIIKSPAGYVIGSRFATLTVMNHNIVIYNYSGSEKITTAGHEYIYGYNGQMYLDPDNTNGVFIGWGVIGGHRQFWVSPFSDFLLTTVQGRGGRVFTVLGKSGDGVDENGRPSIWSYFHKGLNAELNIGSNKRVALPVTFDCDITRVYPDTTTGEMILREANSTYTFSPTTTQKANNAGKTIWDLVNDRVNVLIHAGYQEQ
jgi:hypothetical protein